MKLKHDELLSFFAFNFNLRRSSLVAALLAIEVRRCMLTPGGLRLDRAWFQFNQRLKLKHDEVLSSFAFNFNLRRYIEGLAAPGSREVVEVIEPGESGEPGEEGDKGELDQGGELGASGEEDDVGRARRRVHQYATSLRAACEAGQAADAARVAAAMWEQRAGRAVLDCLRRRGSERA